MSYQRAVDALNLKKPDKIPHCECIDHPDFIRKVTGIDPYQNYFDALVKMYRVLDIDLVFHLPEKKRLKRREELTSGKHVKFTKWGVLDSLWMEPPFKHLSTKEILDFDPCEENMNLTTKWINLPSSNQDIDQIAGEFTARFNECQGAVRSSSVYLGGYYMTLYMWPRLLFDFEAFTIAAIQEPRAFGELLDRFAQISKKYLDAWSRTGVQYMYIHDDIALTRGPVFAPKWYDKYLFPRYKKIWEPLKQKGIKIIFCSDGNLDLLIDGLVEAGADGFQIEPVTNMELLAKKYGDRVSIMGNISTQILTFKGEKEIEEEIKRCIREAGECPGFFLYCSQPIPYNVPLENIEAYFKLCEKYDQRD